MKAPKYPGVLGCLLVFLKLMVEVHGQLTVTASIHEHTNHLEFPPGVFEEFHDCMCSQKVTCTISYYFTNPGNEYIVNNVFSSEDKKSSSEEPTHYICDLFVFSDNNGLDCKLQNITDNACSGEMCSTIAYVQNTSSCPCITIQWLQYSVSYSNTCGQEGQCNDLIVPTKETTEHCPKSDETEEINDDDDENNNSTNVDVEDGGGGGGEGGGEGDGGGGGEGGGEGDGGGEGEEVVDGDTDGSSGDNQVVFIGAGLGGALVIVITIGAIALYILWRRKKPADQEVNSGQDAQPADQDTDRVQEAQPNCSVSSKISYKGSRQSVDSSQEDNYGYIDLVDDPYITYYEIGEDGELAACRDQEIPVEDFTLNASVAEDTYEQVGSKDDGYVKVISG